MTLNAINDEANITWWGRRGGGVSSHFIAPTLITLKNHILNSMTNHYLKKQKKNLVILGTIICGLKSLITFTKSKKNLHSDNQGENHIAHNKN